MFAAENRHRLSAAISFAVCATAPALQLDLAAGPSKLNLSAKSTEAYSLS
jgi:hypothetical protein